MTTELLLDILCFNVTFLSVSKLMTRFEAFTYSSWSSSNLILRYATSFAEEVSLNNPRNKTKGKHLSYLFYLGCSVTGLWKLTVPLTIVVTFTRARSWPQQPYGRVNSLQKLRRSCRPSIGYCCHNADEPDAVKQMTRFSKGKQKTAHRTKRRESK